MIIEALTHLLTPAPKYVKKMGYLKEAIAIEARVKRCRGAWAPHLDKCKTLILGQAEALPSGSEVLILGSGGLHDVPIRRLLKMGHHVTCVDIVHLPIVKKRFPEVTFIEKDLTSVAQDLYYGQEIDTGFGWEPSARPDLTVSLNLLSQLPLSLIGYAKRNRLELPDDFKQSVTKAHVKWLRGLHGEKLLISDITRKYNIQNKIIETNSALSVELGEPLDTWDWDIAPKGEVDRKINVVHYVGAWVISPTPSSRT